jgi:PTS system fructose-specific IIA component/PTS system nitrogen regulatory IIA component
MSLRDIFLTTAILDPAPATKADLLARLVALLTESGELPVASAPSVLAAILHREALGSTGIARGFAIPHCRGDASSPIVGILGVCRPGVPFNALDGEPVDIVALLILNPNPGSYLRTLEVTSRELGSIPFRQNLRDAATADDLATLLESVGPAPTGRVPCPGPVAPRSLDLRKARLFACACGRLTGLPAALKFAAEAERFSDGLVPASAVPLYQQDIFPRAIFRATAEDVLGLTLSWAADRRLPCEAQVATLGDIFGPHTRHGDPIDADCLAWNSGAVGRIAEGIYQAGTFAELPVLADALEDAGCIDRELLAHLRGPGPHVRGCWALDLSRGIE